jgi:membrane protein DedA with SNARE-associated domain
LSFETVYAWIALHPHYAGLAVFLIAMAESLAVVGLLIPGVAMMFAAGALVGAGALAFVPTCGYAIAGAIAGDGISFWLGWRYRDRLSSLWPFTRYPGMIERGIDYFHRYGGRSVLFGRFVGPIRAVIPLVAGMLAMPARRFIYINVLSAVLWGPAYLLPGMAFGASLDLASQVTGRLAALLIALLAVLWFGAWLSKHLYLYFQPRAHQLILATFDLSREHPLLGRLTAPLIDPEQRDYAGLSVWAAILGLSAVLACYLVPTDLMPVSLEAWRNPWADYALIVFEELGGTLAVSAFSAVVLGWLLIRKQSIAGAHFLGALVFALMFGTICGLIEDNPLIDSHVLNGGAVYGFAAVLTADSAMPRWRWLIYSAATLLVIIIAFARVYADTGEFLAVCVTLSVVLVWLVLLGVAYRRHRHGHAPIKGLTGIAMASLVGIATFAWYSHSLEEFFYRRPLLSVDEHQWLEQGWRFLPAYRVETIGRPKQPLSIQWASSIEAIRSDLAELGWQEPKPLTATQALQFLNPQTEMSDLPVLPHFNQTDVDVLRMIKATPEGRWLIVRFWPSGQQLQEGAIPIWLGSIAFLEERSLFGVLKFSEEASNGLEALKTFINDLRPHRPFLLRTTENDQMVVLIAS